MKWCGVVQECVFSHFKLFFVSESGEGWAVFKGWGNQIYSFYVTPIYRVTNLRLISKKIKITWYI